MVVWSDENPMLPIGEVRVRRRTPKRRLTALRGGTVQLPNHMAQHDWDTIDNWKTASTRESVRQKTNTDNIR